MNPPPNVAIAGYHQDDEGHWVAELACGHGQHVRHRPPLESRPWVTTEEGRRQHIGTLLPCSLCQMPKLPEGLVEYRRTAEFDTTTVPRGLLASHTLKEGTWGVIVVTAGHVVYVLEDGARIVLRQGVDGIVAPTRPHHVELAEGARFLVRFLRSGT